MPASSLYIGLMSGTSLDGVDGVLADFAGRGIRTLDAAFTPFPPELRAELMALQAASDNELEREALAANGLARCYADCVRALLAHAPGPVRAVAVHGQTIRHRPELGFTRQTNNPALLAELTGIDVIADFRSRDVAAGGQGAPLVPAFHEARFGKPAQVRVVVNIGGIGNISVLHGDGRVSGFDTGPGNVLDGFVDRAPPGQGIRRGRRLGRERPVDPPCCQPAGRSPTSASRRPRARGATCSMEWLDARLARFPAWPRPTCRRR
jgi:anhydro-N-acetylmuramic acid kinase